jgi:radical SAM protein with 4Fe4S-binding SPASM domain
MTHVYLKNKRYLYFIDSNRIVNKGISDLFLKYAPNQKINWEDSLVNEGIIKYRIRHLQQVIFETSQNCNMSCSYCLYGGDYLYQREKSSKTHSRDLPINEVFHFFLTDDRVKKNPVELNFVNHLDTDYYEKNLYDKSVGNTRINKIIKIITEKKLNGQSLAPIEENLFNLISNMEKRLKKRNITFLANTCLFDKRIYISADGVFHICEKMNHQFPFGDCHKGFDFPRMTKIAHEFIDLIKQKCRDCEARFLCHRCYIHFARNGKFEMNPDFCDMNKRLIQKLENIIELKERGVL